MPPLKTLARYLSYAKAIRCRAVVLILGSVLSGCGGGMRQPSVPVQQPVLSVSAAKSSVAVNQSLALNAIVSSAANAPLTWSVSGALNGNSSVGTIKGSGLSVTYTAPAAMPAPNPVTVTVALGSQAGVAASVNIAIEPAVSSIPVSIWLTTHDRKQLLYAQPGVAFTGTLSSGKVIYVDEQQSYQEVEGFGAAFTDSATYLLHQVATPSDHNAAMRALFTRDQGGIGLSFMRNPIGASDLSLSWYTFDDMPSGQSDPSLANFSIAHDQQNTIPIIQEARQLNPQLKLMANPWTPPAWMKTSDSMIGGSLVPSVYGTFAQYLMNYLQAYATSGIAVDYLGLQNEPNSNPSYAPGMLMDAPTQQVLLRQYVLPLLAASNIPTKVLIWDSNWDTPTYPQAVLSDPELTQSSQIAGISWHGYGGTPAVQSNFQRQGIRSYELEHSGGAWISDQAKADFEEITHAMRNWGRSYVKWSLALDENNGPAIGGCENRCTPLVTIDSQSGVVSYNIEYYTIGHFSRFILPGASRIYSSNAAGLVSVAFLNPDTSKALIVFNDTTMTQTFMVQWGSQTFPYTLGAFAGATFTWAGQQQGAYSVSCTSQIQASSYNDALWLMTDLSQDTDGGYYLGWASDGDYARYDNIDFGEGVTQVTARVASASSGGTVEFHLDSADGPLIGTLAIPATGGWQSWTTVSAPTSVAAGIHNLYVVFRGSAPIGNLNWFHFS